MPYPIKRPDASKSAELRRSAAAAAGIGEDDVSLVIVVPAVADSEILDVSPSSRPIVTDRAEIDKKVIQTKFQSADPLQVSVMDVEPVGSQCKIIYINGQPIYIPC